MIKVCDAIMGSGKSQSAIAYMNEHSDKCFVYVTPYLDEAARIRDGCPDLHFVEPSDRLPQYDYSKLKHTRALMQAGRNIATTHSAFRSYTPDMIDFIREHDYTLIIDEAVDVFQEVKYSDGDVKLLLDGGYISQNGDMYSYTGNEYTGTRLKDLFEMLLCNNLVPVDRGAKGTQYYYWTTPHDVLCSFSEVFVLTYMFESSEFKYFLDLHGLEYVNIGIHREGDSYHFVDEPDYVPEYVYGLADKLHIFDNPKLNKVGRNRCALSAHWMDTHREERKDLKNHLYNYFHNYNRGCGHDNIMWSTYNNNVSSLRGKGFANRNVTFNMKATNDYRDRNILAYCVNIFVSPNKTNFFAQHGITYDEDGYALSTMIQWIWRSAIRDGEEVWVYVPSRRMRELLSGWIERVSNGGKTN